MVIESFEQLIKNVQNFEGIKKVAVVAAQDSHTIEAVYQAVDNNIIKPIFIGNREQIEEIIIRLGRKISDVEIINTLNDNESALKAVELARDGEVQLIMKGKIQTADLLKAVVNKENGLRTGSLMSHFVIIEAPGYHKLLVTTDGGMIMYPDLEQKKKIIENAVGVLYLLGYENPKIAVLAAVEKINPKMPESIDAGRLKEMNQSGKITGCVVEGPISYDLAVCKTSAEIKGYESPVAGDADVLIVPNITAGNILGKCLTFTAGAKMAGFIVGAKVPIILTSRGSTTEEKYLSLVLSAAAS
ncbi:MAG TPA: bifunctional enoyl-CoA hydratase/phosphate acetyltransferase [Anaerovoracaceae bacterium]|nr:bifunctional enoyl-CoA hydratase/phosphate acetyltransferase [Anaerovoracaceae bacterium]